MNKNNKLNSHQTQTGYTAQSKTIVLRANMYYYCLWIRTGFYV